MPGQISHVRLPMESIFWETVESRVSYCSANMKHHVGAGMGGADGRTDGATEGLTDGRTDGGTEGRREGWTDGWRGRTRSWAGGRF